VLLVRVATDQAAVNEARRQLEGVAREVESVNLPAQIRAPLGDPAEQILALIQREQADLVVMATRRSALERLFLGSVATQVVRRSHVPVVTLRPGNRRITAIKKVLLPLEDAPEGTRILPVIHRLAPALEAEIVLLRVLPAFPLPQADWAVGGVEEVLERDRAEAEQELRGIADDLARAGLRSRILLGQTPVVDAILEAIDAEQAELVAMATRARGGLERAVLGSTTDAVIHRAPVPVLTLSLAAADRGGQQAGR
jgi:nucleotide-binding universal stress UspA family protein